MAILTVTCILNTKYAFTMTSIMKPRVPKPSMHQFADSNNYICPVTAESWYIRVTPHKSSRNREVWEPWSPSFAGVLRLFSPTVASLISGALSGTWALILLLEEGRPTSSGSKNIG